MSRTRNRREAQTEAQTEAQNEPKSNVNDAFDISTGVQATMRAARKGIRKLSDLGVIPGFNPRANEDFGSIVNLAKSLAAGGQETAMLVFDPEAAEFVLPEIDAKLAVIRGHRRLQAAAMIADCLANDTLQKVLGVERSVFDPSKIAVEIVKPRSLIELNRLYCDHAGRLNPKSRRSLVKTAVILADSGLSQEAIAASMGYNTRQPVQTLLRIARMSPEVRNTIWASDHAKATLSKEDFAEWSKTNIVWTDAAIQTAEKAFKAHEMAEGPKKDKAIKNLKTAEWPELWQQMVATNGAVLTENPKANRKMMKVEELDAFVLEVSKEAKSEDTKKLVEAMAAVIKKDSGAKLAFRSTYMADI